MRLERVGEAVFENGVWSVNDEQAARRNFVTPHGAFFHFRHWYDVVRRGIVTVLPEKGTENCMVLRIRVDNTLAYESCTSALEFDKIEWKGTEQFKAQLREKAVSNMLTKIRRIKESGKEVKSRQKTKTDSFRGKHSTSTLGVPVPEEELLSHRSAMRSGGNSVKTGKEQIRKRGSN